MIMYIESRTILESHKLFMNSRFRQTIFLPADITILNAQAWFLSVDKDKKDWWTHKMHHFLAVNKMEEFNQHNTTHR